MVTVLCVGVLLAIFDSVQKPGIAPVFVRVKAFYKNRKFN